MLDRHVASPRPRALVVAVAALLAWASIVASASAAPNKKTFSASVGPNPLVAGASYSVFPRAPIVYTIRNTSTSAELGSANVTVPAGIAASTVTNPTAGTATLVGTLIQLRELSLAPGESSNVLVWAQVECAANHATYRWTTAVKQSNDFNGTGNDLTGTSPTSTVAGTCGLSFTAQPAHSEKATIITSEIYKPAGQSVTVTVLDGEGIQTVTWWSGTVALTIGDDPTGGATLSGGVSGSPTNGVVTFTPSIDLSATGFSLDATATPTPGSASIGTSGVESNSFNIVDDATICTALVGCSAEAGFGQKTSAHVQASANGADGDLVILTINDPAVEAPNCAGYNETSDLVVFNVTDSTGEGDSTRSKITTLTLLEAFVTKSASKYQVCYDDGLQAPYLLPKCDNQTPEPPCWLSREINQAKDLVIVISSPPGDPAVKF
jgi:hypothetical protein